MILGLRFVQLRGVGEMPQARNRFCRVQVQVLLQVIRHFLRDLPHFDPPAPPHLLVQCCILVLLGYNSLLRRVSHQAGHPQNVSACSTHVVALRLQLCVA